MSVESLLCILHMRTRDMSSLASHTLRRDGLRDVQSAILVCLDFPWKEAAFAMAEAPDVIEKRAPRKIGESAGKSGTGCL